MFIINFNRWDFPICLTVNFLIQFAFHLETWPRRADQFYSTSGTSATVVFIKNGKMYTAHVGDSRIVLGYQNKGNIVSNKNIAFVYSIIVVFSFQCGKLNR